MVRLATVSVRGSLASRNAKRLLIGIDQAARHGGERVQSEARRDSWRRTAMRSRAGESSAALAWASGRRASGRHGERNEFGIRRVCRRACAASARDPAGRHLFFIQSRPGHGLQAALTGGARGGGVAQSGGEQAPGSAQPAPAGRAASRARPARRRRDRAGRAAGRGRRQRHLPIRGAGPRSMTPFP